MDNMAQFKQDDQYYLAQEAATELLDTLMADAPFYPPLHHTGPCADRWHMAQFPVAEKASRTGLWLPCGPEIKDHEVEQVCGVIRKHYGE